ncbi:MAG: hypothetical protein HDT39_08815 [Lachnospiraceae bacterium]|nr:hypothetical protein [Lachnospiraceae bacterium]
MKIYLNKKDRIIQNQNKIIEKLREENEYLREELAKCDIENISEKISLAEISHETYLELISELENIRHEYLMLIRDIKNDNRLSRLRKQI